MPYNDYIICVIGLLYVYILTNKRFTLHDVQRQPVDSERDCEFLNKHFAFCYIKFHDYFKNGVFRHDVILFKCIETNV